MSFFLKKKGIVLELQRDCLDQAISVSSILRKSKVIASKLDLSDLIGWIENELNGYVDVKMGDLPSHRKSRGSPKFWNPYRGYCPILVNDDKFGDLISTVYLSQSVGALEELAKSKNGTLIYSYPPGIQEVLRRSMDIDMECSLHFSANQVKSTLDYVRNRILDWTLELEKRGIIGEDLTFDETEKREAQAVTNHIYGSNIGVLGTVGHNAKVSHQSAAYGGFSPEEATELVAKIREAAGGLPSSVREALVAPLNEMEEGAKTKEASRIQGAVEAMVPILQNASGSLVASSILAALGIA